MAVASSLVGVPAVSALTESLPEISEAEILGAHERERLGQSLSDAGDFNGDGFGDLIVGGRARAYIVLGGAAGDVDLTSSERSIEIGFASPDPSHDYTVAGARDVNSDGLDDVLIGIPQADPLGRKNAGSVFLIFGREDRGPILLDPVPAPRVVRIDGASQGDRAGTSVASARDVDGDEVPDVIVGAPRADDGSGQRRGAAYVMFGRTLTKNVDLALLSSEGYKIHRPNFGRDVGQSVATAGDMNRDGLDDVIIGVPSSMVIAPPAAYVVFGQPSTDAVTLGNLSGKGWLIRGGDKENERGAGEAVAGGHDVNADGVPDVVVGAPSAAGPFHRNGVVFVIFGKADNATVALDALGDAGFRIFGGDRAQSLGSAVAMLPDQDNDGSADVLIGAPSEQRGPYGEADYGAVYHLVGQSSTEDVHLWRLGSAGVRYSGEGFEEAGASVAALMNFDGDDKVDLAAGAPRHSGDAGEAAGRAYVFKPTEAPAHDNPPRVEIRSYDTYQRAQRGSSCWDGLCVDRIPTFPRADDAGTGNRAHYRIKFPERPDSFSLAIYRELDQYGRPTGEATTVDATLSPVRLYQGAQISSYEAVFRLPKRPGDIYLVGTGSWAGDERGDASWFSHLELRRQDRYEDMPSWPDMTLFTEEGRQRGYLLYASCWSRSFSDGTGVSMCYDLAPRLAPRRTLRASPRERAYVRIYALYRPNKIRFKFQRQLSEYYTPSGPARRVHYRLERVRENGKTVAWDMHFRLPRRKGHLYPTVAGHWDQGSVVYDWHLRLR